MGMLSLLIFIFATAAAAVPGQAAKPSRGGPVEELRDIEQRLAEAWVKGDRDFINRILADDWRVTDAAGRILDKRQVMQEAFESKDRQVESLQIDDVDVRILKGCAIVTGRTRATGRYKGSSSTVTLRFTDVFVRRAGTWKVVASQATLITQ